MNLLLKFIFLFLITELSKIDCWETRSCGTNPSCEFKQTFLSQITAQKFPKHCSTICGFLIIQKTDLNAEELTGLFKNIRILVGGLQIVGTKLENLKFLAGLRRFVQDNRYGFSSERFKITYNPELRELGLLNLTTIKSRSLYIANNEKLEKLNLPKLEVAKCLRNNCTIRVSIKTNASKFCITLKELNAFTKKRNKCDLNIDSGICIPENEPRVCTVPTEGCERLIGDLNITKGFDVRKVESLKRLYGTLNITNTDFTDFRFLGNLTRIVRLGYKTALVVVGNKLLRNMEFPKLRRIDSEIRRFAHFADNSEASHADFKSCYALRKAALQKGGLWQQFGDGRSCEQIEFPPTR
ncbi:hypothetical protein B9Z55_012136 [Caenorhabditis nigoni]|nr:hypothetical protein B9Z55_012136 [Caenorhabditis nigoni]